MDIKKIIDKKSKNKELTQAEIEYFVNGYTTGHITDYQASALLMAIKIFGMTEKETFALTNAMLHSGEIINLDELGMVVDKHSTGGISDTTTIALAPICAACGVKMLKLSGRGLGFTGGTIDKLEAFSGFNVELPDKDYILFDKETTEFVETRTQTSVQLDKSVYSVLKKINNNEIEEFNEKTLKQILRLLHNIILNRFGVEIKSFEFI